MWISEHLHLACHWSKQSLLPRSLFSNLHTYLHSAGPDIGVGIATGYGVDGPGFESWWGRDFSHPSKPALGSTQPPVQWVPDLSRGYRSQGVALTTHLASRLKKESGLHLYSSSGVSWPLLRWTLPLPLLTFCSQDRIVGIVIRYRMDCPGIESRWDEIFRVVQTGLQVHFVSCTMGIRSFPGERQPECGFDQRFLVPGCEWVGITPPLPLCACTGMSWNGLYLHYRIIYY
jgi:hypothetical protein